MDCIGKLGHSDEPRTKMGALRDERGDEIELPRGCAALLPCGEIRQLEPVDFLLGQWVNDVRVRVADSLH